MIQLKEITDQKLFNSFVEQSKYCHYMKTSMYGEVRKYLHRNSFYSMLGFYEDDRLVATALVMHEYYYAQKYLYIPKGPCMDYTNEPLRAEVFQLLRKWGQDQKGIFLRVDPDVERIHRTISGKPIDDGYNGEQVTAELKALGYVHKGYNYAYDGSFTNRYTLIVDLSPSYEEIKKKFKSARRTDLNRHAIFGIQGEIGTKEDLLDLMRFEKQLSEIDGFKPHKKEFFETWLNAFGKHAVLYKVTVDFQTMKEGLTKELANKKYKKDPEAKAAIEAFDKETDENLSKYGAGRRIIAMGLFIRFGKESWDLYTYNDKNFSYLKATDQIHNIAMQDMKANGVIQYDMCGFSGVVDPKDPEYGLYVYKSSFGPRYVEMIGEFDAVYNEHAMKRFKFNKRAENGIRRRINAKIYKKK